MGFSAVCLGTASEMFECKHTEANILRVLFRGDTVILDGLCKPPVIAEIPLFVLNPFPIAER